MKKVIIVLMCSAAIAACTPTLGGVYGDSLPEQLALGEKGSKTGVAKCVRIFGYNTGDCSIGAAMAAGQISDLRTVKTDSFNLLLYKSDTTTVTGE